MANYNIKTTGTKTTGSSIIGDWTDANCYPASEVVGIAVAAGDTLVFDAGNYALTNRWLVPVSVTISTRLNGDVVLSLISPAAAVFQPSAESGATVTVNDIKIDPTNATIAGLRLTNRAATYNAVFNNLEFVIGGLAALESDQRAGNCTFNNLSISGVYTSANICNSTVLGLNGNAVFTIDGLALNTFSGRSGQSKVMRFNKGNAATTLDFVYKNVTGTHDCRTFSTSQGGIIEINGASTVDVSNNNLTLFSDSSAGSGVIKITGLDASNRRVNSCETSNNTVNFNAYAGTAIDIGTDDTVGLMVNPQTHNNTVIGGVSPPVNTVTPHGVVHRGMSDCDHYANKVSRFHSPVMLSTCSNGAKMYGNYIFDSYGALLSAKGNTGGDIFNNTVVITPLSFSTVIFLPNGMWAREQAATVNTAITYSNNNIIAFGVSSSNVFTRVGIDVNDTATFTNNNFYSDGALPADAWEFKGSTYGTLAAWNAAEGNNATDKDNFTSTSTQFLANNGDADITPKLSTIGGGVDVTSTGPRVSGLDDEPFSDTEIDQGAIQSTHSPNHPANL